MLIELTHQRPSGSHGLDVNPCVANIPHLIEVSQPTTVSNAIGQTALSGVVVIGVPRLDGHRIALACGNGIRRGPSGNI